MKPMLVSSHSSDGPSRWRSSIGVITQSRRDAGDGCVSGARYSARNRIIATAELAAVAYTATGQDSAPASGGSSARAAAMPTGQEETSSPVAVEISRPANQSVVTVGSSTISTTEPAPASRRPAKASANPSLAPNITDPAVISASAAAITALSP